MRCPCGTEQNYEECCGPFLDGSKVPMTAEQLMRSRYTAFTQANINYIENTLAPSQKSDFNREDTLKWAKENHWKKLDILSTKNGGPEDKTGIVDFIATYEKDGEGFEHHEVAEFRRSSDGKWLFFDGDSHAHREGEGHHHHSPQAPVVRTESKVGRNDPCPCGSGKKSKKCCAT